MLFKTTPLAGQHLSLPSSIPSLNCLTELKMYPLLHEERVFVCFFPGQMEDFLPPWEREREAEGGGSSGAAKPPLTPVCHDEQTPRQRGEVTLRAANTRQRRSQRDDYVTEERRGVSMSDLSLTRTQTHQKPRILQLPWVVIIWDGSLLSGPAALIYISITPDRWRKESPTSASIIFITN